MGPGPYPRSATVLPLRICKFWQLYVFKYLNNSFSGVVIFVLVLKFFNPILFVSVFTTSLHIHCTKQGNKNQTSQKIVVFTYWLKWRCMIIVKLKKSFSIKWEVFCVLNYDYNSLTPLENWKNEPWRHMEVVLTLPSLIMSRLLALHCKACWDIVSCWVTQRRADLMSGDLVHFWKKTNFFKSVGSPHWFSSTS